MYTNSPDGHFVIDRHPEHSNVLIVSPCSGHGFKFCPVVGEIVSDFVERGASRHDIGTVWFEALKGLRPTSKLRFAPHARAGTGNCQDCSKPKPTQRPTPVRNRLKRDRCGINHFGGNA
jgi:hypothetical protein